MFTREILTARPVGAAVLVLTLLWPGRAAAQPLPFDRWTPAFPSERAREVSSAVSWWTVGTSLALDAKASCLDAADRKRGCGLFGVRTGVTWGSAAFVKWAVGRQRPCNGDRKSTYSLHTAFAFQGLGGPRASVVWSLGIATAGGRIGGCDHWLSDTVLGAAAGAAAGKWIR